MIGFIQRIIRVVVFLSVFMILACSEEDESVAVADKEIKLNQLGFYTEGTKVAVVPEVKAQRFALVSEEGAEVFSADLGPLRTWPFSEEKVHVADFSAYRVSGSYRLRVPGLPDSNLFTIGEQVFHSLNRAALKSYYYNRSGIKLPPQYAGPWARPAGHPDRDVRVHTSAASAQRPQGSLIASPKGWYDAGDYNKYVVNSGITTYTLLAAYEHYPQYYRNLKVGIPESDNQIADVIDEALWNIYWMLSMQDPEDGGVYHKLTTLSFEDFVMPHQAKSQRYVVQKSTAATLDFAAVMAVAARVLPEYEQHLPGLAAQCGEAAVSAWQWAKQNPNRLYQQPSDVKTGAYGDKKLSDEFAWAAAELYITLGKPEFYAEFKAYRQAPSVPSWSDVATLPYISLLHHRKHLDDMTKAGEELDGELKDLFLTLADSLGKHAADSAYAVVMGAGEEGDFVWGSNGLALNQSMVLLQAYRLTAEGDYLEAAMANLDYVLGRNALDISFVTGFGHRSPMHIHHRPSEADGIVEPVPGFIIGGPYPGQPDDCQYPSPLPAKSYVDDKCSYSTNEIAINWNAPLVYVTGALESVFQ